MAVQVHDHLHLDTANPPVTEYYVLQGTLDHSQEVSVAYERGITGLLHIHRLEDGVTAGKPIQFDADKETIVLRGTDAIADLATLKSLAGRTVYMVPNYHDDADLGTWPTSSYIVRCVLNIQPGGVTNVDPMMTMFTIQVGFTDHDKVTG